MLQKIDVFYNANGCQCLECGIFKPWPEFDRLQSSVTGYSFTCHACENANKKHYHDAPKRVDWLQEAKVG